jgi:hypothetical protein
MPTGGHFKEFWPTGLGFDLTPNGWRLLDEINHGIMELWKNGILGIYLKFEGGNLYSVFRVRCSVKEYWFY